MALYYTRKKLTFPDGRVVLEQKIVKGSDIPESMLAELIKSGVIVNMKDRHGPIGELDAPPAAPKQSAAEAGEEEDSGENGESEDDEPSDEPDDDSESEEEPEEVKKPKAKKKKK